MVIIIIIMIIIIITTTSIIIIITIIISSSSSIVIMHSRSASGPGRPGGRAGSLGDAALSRPASDCRVSSRYDYYCYY